ncbi:uncharacterized protein LOC111445546 isoform X1 [Cucurbita moschata]|uniref:Uncharacterized protein LOC111445546 isoform X1 n=1 Tax=Cucurbita moschata TaxID=3662 RepID=A0A6J1FI52_CUCMO|nr:uncharacterized protein LOC111445546 isoform X1 [Cucurbita moschata]
MLNPTSLPITIIKSFFVCLYFHISHRIQEDRSRTQKLFHNDLAFPATAKKSPTLLSFPILIKKSEKENSNMEKDSSRPTRRQRFAVDDGADLIDCSGKQCQSCTTGLVADCVAIWLCPCSVVSFLALALVKLPWMIGRRCLQQRRQKRKLIGRRGEREGGGVAAESGGGAASEEGLPPWFGEEEAERIWVQLHQVGQLGFGTVSFTGNTNL